jgi:hypothetical protein
MFKQFLDSQEVSALPHNSVKNFVMFGCPQLWTIHQLHLSTQLGHLPEN